MAKFMTYYNRLPIIRHAQLTDTAHKTDYTCLCDCNPKFLLETYYFQFLLYT